MRILVVDDDLNSRILISRMVSDIIPNCSVITANNGLEAIKIMNDYDGHGIMLIFIDMKMPYLSGYETVRLIRKINSDVKIVIQTAFNCVEIESLTREIGCDGYIIKPILKDRLIYVLKSIGF